MLYYAVFGSFWEDFPPLGQFLGPTSALSDVVHHVTQGNGVKCETHVQRPLYSMWPSKGLIPGSLTFLFCWSQKIQQVIQIKNYIFW